MPPSPKVDMKAFVPAKDHKISKAFYCDLGFTIKWSNDEIAELQLGAFRFLLQKFYVAEHAGNFMMSLNVENADAWWEHIQRKELTKEISRHHVQASRDAALGYAGALLERPYRRSLAYQTDL